MSRFTRFAIFKKLLLLTVLSMLVGCTTLAVHTGDLTPEETCDYAEQYEQCVALMEPYFNSATRQQIIRRRIDQIRGLPVNNNKLIQNNEGVLHFLIDDMLLVGILGDAAGSDFLRDSFRWPRFVTALTETGQLDKAMKYIDMGLKEAFMLIGVMEQNSDALSYDRHLLVNRIQNLGISKAYIIWFETGDAKTALSTLKAVQNVTNRYGIEPSGMEAKYHLDAGLFYEKMLGDYAQALQEYQLAIRSAEQMGTLATDTKYGIVLNANRRIVNIYMKMGRLEEAKRVLEQYNGILDRPLLKLGKIIVKDTPMAQDYFSLMSSDAGALFSLIRDFKTAKRYFDETGEILQRSTSGRALGSYRVMYGAYYLALQGDYREAARWVDLGLQDLKPRYLSDIQMDLDIETAYTLAAELYYVLNDNDQALQRAEQALNLAGRYHNRLVQARALTLIGQIRYRLGQYEDAERYYVGAHELVGNVESTENWKLFYGLGQVYENKQDVQSALRFYRKAVQEVEKLWDGRFKDTQRQLSVIDNRLIVYEPVIRLAAKQNNAMDVVRYMEQSKARTFFDTITALHTASSTPSGWDSSLPPATAEIQKRLPADTALLEYYVGEASVIAVLITSDTLEVRRLAINARQLRQQVGEFTDSIKKKGPYLQSGRMLYETLFSPFAEQLSQYSHIGIIPHGVLHYLPFHALPIGGSVSDDTTPVFFVADRHTLFYAPSATILSKIGCVGRAVCAITHPDSAAKSLLAVGSPPAMDLPESNNIDIDLQSRAAYGNDDKTKKAFGKLTAAEKEMENVAGLFVDKQVYTDAQATETVAKRHVNEAGVLLFSTHAMLIRERPDQSFLLFNPDGENDGLLTVAEIESLPIDTDIVVLSACETGLVSGPQGIDKDITRARFPLGDDLFSLQRAFIKSGSASVLSTLWKVSDKATENLVTEFFRAYKNQGMDKAAALQYAQWNTRKQPKWSHPYYWAPFVLSGGWE